MPDSVTQILNSGPPGLKRNIAVLGDGFAAGDQTLYNNKVKELLLDGVFGHDYFYEDAQAFNIFRVNLISNDSGVSQRVYDEHGTPSDASDDTIVSTTLKDTALGYLFSGSWAHCWLENGANTATLVQNAFNTWVPDYDRDGLPKLVNAIATPDQRIVLGMCFPYLLPISRSHTQNLW
jgi:hypothetical protein